MEYVDISSWQEDKANPSGIREKVWLINPQNDERYLFKVPKSEGEVIGEVAAFHLGSKCWDMEIAESCFAIREGVKGNISKSFISESERDKLEFHEIVDYYGEHFDEYDLTEYTLEKALDIVTDFEIEEQFYEMCIFDYLIANQDRHVQNWGIIINLESGEKRFSPLYDNGSSMFAGISDEQLVDYQRDRNRFAAYTNRAVSLFFLDKRKPKFVDILIFLYQRNAELFHRCFKKFTNIDKGTCEDRLKEIGLSKIRQQIIVDLIYYRIEQIKNKVIGEIDRR